MINTLLLPELRQMLAQNDTAELREFCAALHPVNTAEFMEGLTAEEAWRVLEFAEPGVRAEVFQYLDHEKQVEIISHQDRAGIAALLATLPADDRVDLLEGVDNAIVDELIPLLPADERKETLRLSSYEEGTAGAVMTTEVARLAESLTVEQALRELRGQAEHLETIYYIYVVDDQQHLRGVVSCRRLVASMGRPNLKLGDLMETQLVAARVDEDQEEVAEKVARYDLLAIPVVDEQHRLVGIITHDDVLDVMREEAVEDAHRIGGISPLDDGYMETPIFTLSWKRGMWLTILFFGGLMTVTALSRYDTQLAQFAWTVTFIPLVISTGGNSGNQSATLIITALANGHVRVTDWLRVVLRELAMGSLLGGGLGVVGYLIALVVAPNPLAATVVPVTILLVVVSGTLVGAVLPLVFQRLGLDPALMSNPFVASIVDILGILIYINVAMLMLPRIAG